MYDNKDFINGLKPLLYYSTSLDVANSSIMYRLFAHKRGYHLMKH